ncbi:cobalt-precorrin-3 C17-methyltransferase [Syntrophotalea carbinolica DSM 2380]|uniref:Cobalt-precorrin-3 C17-methyltransferase n=1 Tax=Syntrophotalea carbinolica (strain DSM 2380 / NBRC 103641 / GraBd1) TaxID=338963 RepID=Q3A7B3_SYNC1|nr:precorrin-3B C(17)-methyltransferase [Syntrophotalea carbinolica]ABA87731.1 cobalt-precorrin-3 C17-methyltransferase [Syntrophotalea carbinolica DSM 2380]
MVGIGPGNRLDRTRRAEQAIADSQVVAGYHLYLEHIADLTGGKERIASGMMQETERCRAALQRASEGAVVALVSSGDPGVYGMAGLALEMAAAEGFGVPIEIVPGISAANSAAARLGAPLMLDYACVSLSDLLVPWETICDRLSALAAADLVVALYNPRSKKRIRHLDEAVAIMRRHRSDSTPVGIVTAIGETDEQIALTTLGQVLQADVGMRSTVIIGNSTSLCLNGRMITPRGYRL